MIGKAKERHVALRSKEASGRSTARGLRTGYCPKRNAQPSRVAVNWIGVADSALDMGQPTFAP